MYVFFSCEQDVQNQKSFSVQGISSINPLQVELKGAHVDTILFANGNEQLVLSGSFVTSEEVFTYALHFHELLENKNSQIIFQKAPFEKLKESICTYRISGKTIEIVWLKGNMRVFLRDQLLNHVNVAS